MKDPTLEGIESALLDEEKRIKSNPFISELNNAFLSKASLDKTKQCNHCGRNGHTVKDCKFKDRPRLECKFCGRLGHLEDRCFHKKTSEANTVEAVEQEHASLVKEEYLVDEDWAF